MRDMRSIRAATALALLLCVTARAQTTHVVQVLDNRFDPQHVTIEAGDTVRWENPAGGARHNVRADDMSFQSGGTETEFIFEHTFTEAGVNPYHCVPHRSIGMTGTVTVEGTAPPPSVPINPGHNGNWWSGPSRDGEGAQVEVAQAGGGNFVFITIYSYAPQGGQIFLIGVGTPDGASVAIDLFITSGGEWGAGFDPAQTPQTQWGTGIVTSGGCDQLSISLTPNSEFQAQGYTAFTLNLQRLTTSSIPCPYEG